MVVANELIQQAAQMMRHSQQLTAFTGAGASKESGIPTYREPTTGIWAQYDQVELATPFGFVANPKLVWDWHEHNRHLMLSVEPNPGHRTLAQLEERFPKIVTVTENIDDLHERAGSRRVIHLHGNAFTHKCIRDCLGDPTLIDIDKLDYVAEAGPPHCPHCDSLIRPNVVWYGENLPRGSVHAAFEVIARTDVLLVIGLSGAITYRIPDIVKENGGTVIEINPTESLITPLADVWLPAPAGEMLPKIQEALDTL
jgi:NAD-dependent deacetylase